MPGGGVCKLGGGVARFPGRHGAAAAGGGGGGGAPPFAAGGGAGMPVASKLDKEPTCGPESSYPIDELQA